MPPRVLVHVCCGPCAIYPLQALREQGYQVMGLFYNPNIHPLQEYLLRREALQEVARRLEVKIIYLDKEYDPRDFLRQIVFREDWRCFLCQQMRLERTRLVAQRGGFDFFSTTLLSSKKQPHEQVKRLGHTLERSQCGFLYQDFRGGGNYAEKDEGMHTEIYRQNYCGCIYSELERFKNRL